MKISCDLCLEVTRKCNMQCEHCLRGDAQNKSMTYETLCKTLRGIDNIWCVTFTGGEPTLNLDLIEGFIEYCRWHSDDIEVGNFYIVTNGKVFRKRLVELCDRLYNCVCYDNEVSGLAISDDRYHSVYRSDHKRWKRNWERYVYEDAWLDYERPYARPEDKQVLDYGIGLINMGRAKDNRIGVRELEEPSIHYEIHEGTMYISEPVLYITVDGNVILGCDWSYEEMSNHCIGTVDNWNGVMERIREIGFCEYSDEHETESEAV